ncbi:MULTISPECIES: precorrin-6A reductase [unclassified Sedimentibacter]|uniref:precorrin-6A reductase n=1 Tax=unclassified Sedimentibacter TaxID=2649220 RepID=UPI0027E0474A|nr:precorrin-6A reductase [Sedimentibacter sp. MB35-C1]WMJ78356.1 precorrin-6A reductase [Sedimentibacter sp. MB35-C1]
MHVCIFGGTTEGRLLTEFLNDIGVSVRLFVATDYGEQFIKDMDNVTVYCERLDKKEMIELFEKNQFDFVIDATHPFATEVSRNVREAAEFCRLNYLRIVREVCENSQCLYFDSVNEIVSYLNNREGNILLATGSKDLDKFTHVRNYAQRIFVRILPMTSSLERALKLGFSNKNIICMQGPFSEELNIAMINSVGGGFVVTKESSSSGGFEEKASACTKTGAECLVLKRPYEEGITVEKFKELIRGSI